MNNKIYPLSGFPSCGSKRAPERYRYDELGAEVDAIVRTVAPIPALAKYPAGCRDSSRKAAAVVYVTRFLAHFKVFVAVEVPTTAQDTV